MRWQAAGALANMCTVTKNKRLAVDMRALEILTPVRPSPPPPPFILRRLLPLHRSLCVLLGFGACCFGCAPLQVLQEVTASDKTKARCGY